MFGKMGTRIFARINVRVSVLNISNYFHRTEDSPL